MGVLNDCFAERHEGEMVARWTQCCARQIVSQDESQQFGSEQCPVTREKCTIRILGPPCQVAWLAVASDDFAECPSSIPDMGRCCLGQ